MKLKIFNTDNVPTAAKGTMSLHISKTGIMTFSEAASIHLGLKPDSGVMLGQSEESPDQWYVIPTNGDAQGFKLRSKSPTQAKTLAFNSVSLAKLLLETAKLPFGNTKIPIAKTPESFDGKKVFALLTAPLRGKK